MYKSDLFMVLDMDTYTYMYSWKYIIRYEKYLRNTVGEESNSNPFLTQIITWLMILLKFC